MPSSRWWRSDAAVDIGLTGLAVLPWVLPGPSVLVKSIAVVTCVAAGLVARFVTNSYELIIAVALLSILARLLLGIVGHDASV